MLQRWGAVGRTPSLLRTGTGMMLWVLLSFGQSLPCWESCWPGTQAEQPQMHCISTLCLSFPTATNRLRAGDTLTNSTTLYQAGSSKGPKNISPILKLRGDFLPDSKRGECENCFFLPQMAN